MPDDTTGTTHLSFKAPAELVAQFDRLAAILDRPRSGVLVRALQQYMSGGEGAELLEEEENEAAVERGEGVLAEAVLKAIDGAIERGDARDPVPS
jgi:predicted transcriptional regulator